MSKRKKEHDFEEELEQENSDSEKETEKETEKENIIDSIWKFFSSMRLGIILILIIAVASIWGTIFISTDQQGNPDYTAFYGAIWFRTLLFLLCMNLFICSINRLKFIKRSLGEPKVKVGENFLKKLGAYKSFKNKESHEEVVQQVEDAIKSKGYRVFKEEEEDRTYIGADKGRYGVLGSFITHIAFIVIPLAALYGSFTGFSGWAFYSEDQTFSVAQVVEDRSENITDNFQVRVDKFWIDYRDDGSIGQYNSRLTVIDDNQEQFTKDIYVNDPLEYKGVKFYQSNYVLVTDLIFETYDIEENEEGEIEETSEREEFVVDTRRNDPSFELQKRVADREDLMLSIRYYPDFDPSNPMQVRSTEPNNPAIIYGLHQANPIQGNWEQMDMGVLLQGEELIHDGTVIAFKGLGEETNYTGLSVRKDPGVWYVWVGCFFLLLGMFMSYYLQHRKIWAVVSTKDKAVSVDIGGKTDKNKLEFENDFEQITEKLEEKK